MVVQELVVHQGLRGRQELVVVVVHQVHQEVLEQVGQVV